mmetsp:Transcript_4047/g.16922  ORF Transcript_4047/g.16922 Transcript_4047/m.16922 type:complete len:369 (-) Transcript_4047:272-1378(-)
MLQRRHGHASVRERGVELPAPLGRDGHRARRRHNNVPRRALAAGHLPARLVQRLVHHLRPREGAGRAAAPALRGSQSRGAKSEPALWGSSRSRGHVAPPYAHAQRQLRVVLPPSGHDTAVRARQNQPATIGAGERLALRIAAPAASGRPIILVASLAGRGRRPGPGAREGRQQRLADGRLVVGGGRGGRFTPSVEGAAAPRHRGRARAGWRRRADQRCQRCCLHGSSRHPACERGAQRQRHQRRRCVGCDVAPSRCLCSRRRHDSQRTGKRGPGGSRRRRRCRRRCCRRPAVSASRHGPRCGHHGGCRVHSGEPGRRLSVSQRGCQHRPHQAAARPALVAPGCNTSAPTAAAASRNTSQPDPTGVASC